MSYHIYTYCIISQKYSLCNTKTRNLSENLLFFIKNIRSTACPRSVCHSNVQLLQKRIVFAAVFAEDRFRKIRSSALGTEAVCLHSSYKLWRSCCHDRNRPIHHSIIKPHIEAPTTPKEKKTRLISNTALFNLRQKLIKKYLQIF